jgi:hypothetical protein
LTGLLISREWASASAPSVPEPAVGVQLAFRIQQISVGIARKVLLEKYVVCCARGCSSTSAFAEEFSQISCRNFRDNLRCIAAVLPALRRSITRIDLVPCDHYSFL